MTTCSRTTPARHVRRGWFPFLLIVAGALAAQAQPVTEPDTLSAFAAAVADTDTVPTLDGVIWVDLGEADPDSVLMSGGGVILAFEDTFTFDPGRIDTLLIEADDVDVGEIIEAIGRHMDAEAAARRGVEYTTLTTVVQRDVRSRMGRNYEVTETAERTRHDADGTEHRVRLWERTRKLENGEVVEEEVATESERDFGDVGNTISMAMPFSRGSGHRYRYSIEDRKLVGNSLIYKISFEPKSRFEALPSGTVWVDYSHWVIRKFDAELMETVPFPLFLKGVPTFRVSRERFGGHWFATDMHMEVELRKVPLVGMPGLVEVRTQLRDIVINGEAVTADLPVPRGQRFGNLDPDEFWLSPEASDDSLSAYWSDIGEVWRDDLTPALTPVELTPAQVDTLTRRGSDILDEMGEASPWAWRMRYLVAPGFNRAQGAVPRLGASVWHRGPVRPRLDLTAGYAFGNGRPEGTLDLNWPLVRGDVGGRRFGRRGGPVVNLNLSGWKRAELFAGDDRRHTRTASSLFYGSDPNQYYESRGARARLDWRPGFGLGFHLGAAMVEERALGQTTTWNVLGRSLRPDGNLAAQFIDDVQLRYGASWRGGPLSLAGEVIWHHAEGPDFMVGGSDAVDIIDMRLSGAFDLLDPMGNQWLLKGRHRALDSQGPRQWKTWLGDDGSLRGYPAAELVGDAGIAASLDLRLGIDPLAALRVPVLKNWGLQPLGFADWGRTWNEAGPWPEEGTTGSRWDVGFGIGKRLDLPFTWGFPNVRAYAAKPVGDGSEGRGWRYLVAFEK